MNVVFPVNLEQTVLRSDMSGVPTAQVKADDDYDFQGTGGVTVSVSGRDSSSENGGRGIRLTSLCGIHHGELYKICPHCRRVQPLSAYGDGGRTTDEYRD